MEALMTVLALMMAELPTATYCEMFVAAPPFVICGEGRPNRGTLFGGAHEPETGKIVLCRSLDGQCIRLWEEKE
jgi:hypothetical protein